MYWFKRLVILAMMVSFFQPLQAQHHYNTWFRGMLSIPFVEKIKIDNAFQHSRQNSFENENMFDNNLMFTYRNWVHYEHSIDV
jgi:hypothetical protein